MFTSFPTEKEDMYSNNRADNDDDVHEPRPLCKSQPSLSGGGGGGGGGVEEPEEEEGLFVFIRIQRIL